MKRALARLNYSGAKPQMIWVNECVQVGQQVSHQGCWMTVLEIGEEPPTTEEIICARDLVKGDVFFWNEWCTVNSNWLHPRSPYAKLNITPESEEDRYRLERISGLSVKLNLSQKVRRKTREAVMSIALIEAIDLAKELERNLMDLSALENAPDRIETVASVYVDKQMLVNTIKTNLKAVQGKLSEQIKKL